MDSGATAALQAFLSQKLNQPVNIKSSVPVGGGSINSSALLKTSAGSFFVKWNDRAPPAMFETEALGLAELRIANSGLCIPKVIGYGAVSLHLSFLILEYLQTGPAEPGDQERLGRGLAALHQKTSPRFGFRRDNYCGLTPQKNDWKNSWDEFYLQNRLAFLLEKIGSDRRFSRGDNKALETFIKKLPPLLGDPEPPALIHGDLWSGNCLYTPGGPALFDPAAYYGHREAELGMMFLFGGFGDRVFDAYHEAFPLQKGWRDRLDFYKLYHLLNHFLLFGGHYGAQAVRIARRLT